MSRRACPSWPFSSISGHLAWSNTEAFGRDCERRSSATGLHAIAPHQMNRTAPSHYADPAWCEAQYNPRGAVPNATDIYARWPLESARLRAELPHEANIGYGAHAREVMDVFHATSARGALVFIHGGYWRG